MAYNIHIKAYTRIFSAECLCGIHVTAYGTGGCRRATTIPMVSDIIKFVRTTSDFDPISLFTRIFPPSVHCPPSRWLHSQMFLYNPRTVFSAVNGYWPQVSISTERLPNPLCTKPTMWRDVARWQAAPAVWHMIRCLVHVVGAVLVVKRQYPSVVERPSSSFEVILDISPLCSPDVSCIVEVL